MPINQTGSNLWLTTNRLNIFHPDKYNYHHFFKLLKNSEVTEYLLDFSDEETILRNHKIILNQYETHGYSIGLLFESKSGEFIGRAGYITKEESGNKILNLSYLIMPDFWRQGYGTEAVGAVINFAFNNLEFHEMRAYIHELNSNSHSLIKKFNALYIEEVMIFDKKHYKYVIQQPSLPDEN